MSTIPPHTSHLSAASYQALSGDSVTIPLENNREITFKDPNQLTLQSIADVGKISFSYKKSGGDSKNLSIHIGQKTPLFDDIKKLSGKPLKEQSVAIKALIAEYIGELLNVHEVGTGGIKKVAAQFEKRVCKTILVGDKDVSADPAYTRRIVTAKQQLTNLATPAKVDRVFQQTLQALAGTVSPPPPQPPAEVVDVQDKTGGKKQGELQLSPGTHKIKILHGAKNGQTVDLQTSAPIYRFANAQFGRMSAPGNCLLMQRADFDRIKGMIHPGAFGSDVSDAEIGDGRVAVWKFPADLKEIAGWKASMEVVPNDVGTYHMIDDTTTFSKAPALPGNDTSSIAATKFRMDLPRTASGQPPSVHHLELPDKSQVAGFSTGNLFQDFNAPTPAEKQKTETLLKELDAAGVKAFMCNGNHHLLVLYKNGSGQKMTPRDVADMLQGPQGPAIKEALKKAGKADFNSEEWAKSFINVYGEGPKGAVAPRPSDSEVLLEEDDD